MHNQKIYKKITKINTDLQLGITDITQEVAKATAVTNRVTELELKTNYSEKNYYILICSKEMQPHLPENPWNKRYYQRGDK